MSRWAIAAWASRTWAFDSANFLPPWRPRGREPGQGAFTDQLPLELGQRREDAKHEATGRRGGVDLRALPGEHPQAHAAGRQVLHGVDQVGEVSAEAVELPDNEHVARPERAHAAVEPRPVVADTGREVVVDVDGVDARGLQRVALQVQPLGAVCFSRRGRTRSACIVNGRLRYTGKNASRHAPPCVVSRVLFYVLQTSRDGARPSCGCRVDVYPNLAIPTNSPGAADEKTPLTRSDGLGSRGPYM